MLSQQDQEMRRNVPDPSFAGGSHLCGRGAGNETNPSFAGGSHLCGRGAGNETRPWEAANKMAAGGQGRVRD